MTAPGGRAGSERPGDVPVAPEPLVASVLPDVTGIDKQFDYRVPDELRASLDVGNIVRVPLHGRRVGGWVLSLDDFDPRGEHVPHDRLRAIAKITGRGPGGDVLSLARWAMGRWASRGIRPYLVAASPSRAVTALPVVERSAGVPEPRHAGAAELLASGGGVLRVGPGDDLVPIVAAALAAGPTLVAVPGADQAALLAVRLRRSGLAVALVPEEWARARAGVDVVVGTRTAVWAPCQGLATIVVLDEHDEALQEERSPTWHARDVAIERARRLGASVLLVSPAPTVTAMTWAAGRVLAPSLGEARAAWPVVDLVDRSKEEPWRTSLLTSPLIAALRDPAKTVVCVHNAKGRARLVACRTCRALARCERCEAAVRVGEDERFACARCGLVRPAICRECHGTAFANLRPGVTRLAEEVEAAAGRPVVTVTGDDEEDLPAAAGVYIGTEAVLHRVGRADVVAFLDIDAELLAPRYRAAEQAMALLVRAARLVGPRAGGGRVLVQTSLPRHDVLQAALLADPERLARAEARRRRELQLPPYAALATVTGAGVDEFAASLRSVVPADPAWSVGGLASGRAGITVRGPSWDELGELLRSVPRPKSSRLRIEVDPPRA